MSSKVNHSTTIFRWYLISCILTICSIAYGQDYNGERETGTAYTVEVNIFNRYDDHLIDTTYMDNREVFLMLDSLMRDTAIINHTKRIAILSSSSIEGRESYNKTLSERRMKSIERTLRQRYDYIEADIWDFSYTSENWTYLRKAVVEDQNVPNRDEVLSIIDMEGRDPDTKEYLLKILEDGRPWSYIYKHIIPLSRSSVSMLFVPIAPTAILVPAPTYNEEELVVEISEPELEPTPPRYSCPILSIRSNLILDLTSTINISVEIPLAPRWSLSAEYVNPWWGNWERGFTWQIESLYFDLRYWLSVRDESYNTLKGWSVGAYAGSGCYDLQPFTSDRGVQGEYSDFGVTLSYAHNLGKSRHWLMEYTVGVGYLTTHYRHYYTADNTEEYGDIKVLNYPWSEETLRSPLPTRLGVTLCYLINVNRQKRGGGR